MGTELQVFIGTLINLFPFHNWIECNYKVFEWTINCGYEFWLYELLIYGYVLNNLFAAILDFILWSYSVDIETINC